MFRPYELWAHKSALDTALRIHHVQYRGATYLKVKAALVNRRNGIVYETKTFRIFRKDLVQWTPIYEGN